MDQSGKVANPCRYRRDYQTLENPMKNACVGFPLSNDAGVRAYSSASESHIESRSNYIDKNTVILLES